MANHASAKKRARQNVKRAKVNANRKSRIRTYVKKVEQALLAGDVKAAQEALKEAQPELMRGAAKGVMRKKTAARKLSRLSERIVKSKKSTSKKS
jgi:small subunit ribosomal protein S20